MSKSKVSDAIPELRTGGGVTLGVVGTALGVNGAIAIFSAVLVVGALIAWAYAARTAASRV